MSKDFIKRISDLRKLLKSNETESLTNLQNNLKEQGVRSLFVIPLLEDILGYEQIENYHFEYQISGSGASKLPAVDILLIKENLIIETKPFNSLSNDKNKQDAEDQLKKYIKPKEDEINYGLLTDGVIWEFMIDKLFLKNRCNDGKNVDIDDDIPVCLTFKVLDDNFLNLMMLFHKDLCLENIKKLGDGIVKTIQNTKGGFGWQNIFAKVDDITNQVKCGDIIKNQILNIFKIKKGELYQDIKDGKINIKELYYIEDEYLKIVFNILSNGCIKVISEKSLLKPEKQHQVLEIFPNIIKKLFDEWVNNEESREYESLKELLKDMQGTAKITNYGAKLISEFKKM